VQKKLAKIKIDFFDLFAFWGLLCWLALSLFEKQKYSYMLFFITFFDA
jgi:hypothetical protein